MDSNKNNEHNLVGIFTSDDLIAIKKSFNYHFSIMSLQEKSEAIDELELEALVFLKGGLLELENAPQTSKSQSKIFLLKEKIMFLKKIGRSVRTNFSYGVNNVKIFFFKTLFLEYEDVG